MGRRAAKAARSMTCRQLRGRIRLRSPYRTSRQAAGAPQPGAGEMTTPIWDRPWATTDMAERSLTPPPRRQGIEAKGRPRSNPRAVWEPSSADTGAAIDRSELGQSYRPASDRVGRQSSPRKGPPLRHHCTRSTPEQASHPGRGSGGNLRGWRRATTCGSPRDRDSPPLDASWPPLVNGSIPITDTSRSEPGLRRFVTPRTSPVVSRSLASSRPPHRQAPSSDTVEKHPNWGTR